MSVCNKLQRFIAVACAVLLLVPNLEAHNKKAEKLIKQALAAEAHNDWDSALTLYDEALSLDRQDVNYLIADQRLHTKVSQIHVEQGREFQKAQKPDQALTEFQRAFVADPSSMIALQELRATEAMMKAGGTPMMTPAERARQEVEQRINSLEGPPMLRPINNEISSLKMNNQPARVLYESVAKLAGINVLFDPTGIDTPGAGSHNFNLDLSNVTLEEALNYTGLITHTFWKPISRNAIFVTQESQTKRQEYQDEVVKVFYIQNASTPNEFTEIFNGVRVGSKLTQGIFQVASQNAIIVRGNPDTIAVVEKLIHDLDKPKAEVLMDVIVMEVNKTKTTTLGAALLGQGGLSIPVNFTPRPKIQTPTIGSGSGGSGSGGSGSSGSGSSGTGTTSTAPQVPLNQLQHLSTADWSVTLPSTLIQALMNDASTHVLQRPQLRATDGGKASLKVGQKIPYVSGSLNSAVATPGAIPYATTQFQQIDVGTNVDLQPHVNGPNEISMHVKVELSNVLSQILIAGIEEPEIGQQIDEADIRMKDGEMSILGGLSDLENSLTLSGFPGLTNVPALGYLFGTHTHSNTDAQVLIVIIPHIVRAFDYAAMGDQGVLAGTEQVVRVRRKGQDPGTGSAGGGPVSSTAPGQVPAAPANAVYQEPTQEQLPAGNPNPNETVVEQPGAPGQDVAQPAPNRLRSRPVPQPGGQPSQPPGS